MGIDEKWKMNDEDFLYCYEFNKDFWHVGVSEGFTKRVPDRMRDSFQGDKEDIKKK